MTRPWQPVAVVFPDAEKVLTVAYRAALAAAGETDVYVGRNIPKPRRPRMLIINRDGGANDGTLDRPRMRLRCWDATDEAANDLGRLVVALAPRLVGLNGITRSEHQSGPLDVPDDSEQSQRYVLIEFTVRGTRLT